MAMLEDGSRVPPRPRPNGPKPLVPRALEIQTIERGILTGQMEACGLDWQNRSYLPYMQALRRRYRGKPAAYVGILHGVAQGITAGALAQQGGVCTDAMRADLTAEAANRAIDVPARPAPEKTGQPERRAKPRDRSKDVPPASGIARAVEGRGRDDVGQQPPQPSHRHHRACHAVRPDRAVKAHAAAVTTTR